MADIKVDKKKVVKKKAVAKKKKEASLPLTVDETVITDSEVPVVKAMSKKVSKKAVTGLSLADALKKGKVIRRGIHKPDVKIIVGKELRMAIPHKNYTNKFKPNDIDKAATDWLIVE